MTEKTHKNAFLALYEARTFQLSLTFLSCYLGSVEGGIRNWKRSIPAKLAASIISLFSPEKCGYMIHCSYVLFKLFSVCQVSSTSTCSGAC